MYFSNSNSTYTSSKSTNRACYLGGTDNLYYIHKDYLGNIESITDENGNLIEKLSLDPWGRKHNPTDWTYTDAPYKGIFDRGYTTHEHLDIFGLINMNGRLYDPWLGRMLSPDPFVQAPGNLQNYNRYSYAMNNPLKYTDPSGEFVSFVFGAFMGAYLNVYMNANNINSFGDMFLYAGIGAIAGAATAGIGVAIAGGIEIAGFAGGAIVGAFSGATNGLITGVGNSMVQGEIGNSFSNGLKQSAIQGGIGALTGGLLGGIPTIKDGGNFWTGSKTINVAITKNIPQPVDVGNYGPGNPGMGFEDPPVITITTKEVEISAKKILVGTDALNGIIEIGGTVTLCAGIGFSLELGGAYDGEHARGYFRAEITYGTDASGGIVANYHKPINGGNLTYSQAEGWGESSNLGVTVVDVTYGGGAFHEGIAPSTLSETYQLYRTYSLGVSRGFPLGYTHNKGYTWYFF
ncbi:MAG: hypothetical protein B7C24_17690 [Bacteroidetes bacterium 4572_77]|nr:MAG: hypothetical protein B7C24_17690 [Bacteroidetes bacterium 4572_77]